jgi:hypothetical protein
MVLTIWHRSGSGQPAFASGFGGQAGNGERDTRPDLIPASFPDS